MRCGYIGCLNYRFTAASLTEGESLLHLFKLECRGKECEGLDSEHGCYTAVNENCRIELDNSDMFMLNIEFHSPVNFVCKKCVETSGISANLFARKSSTKNHSSGFGSKRCYFLRETPKGRSFPRSSKTRAGRYRRINILKT